MSDDVPSSPYDPRPHAKRAWRRVKALPLVAGLFGESAPSPDAAPLPASPTEADLPDEEGDAGAGHLELARRSLRGLLGDERVPPAVRQALAQDYGQLQEVLDKLDRGHLHLTACGRVSVGKSALLNALAGREVFSVSPLHGETVEVRQAAWREEEAGGVFLIDTPGLNEIGGESREAAARQAAARSDLVLFVTDGDLTHSDFHALQSVAQAGRPIVLALNKADRFTQEDLETLRQALIQRTRGLVRPEHVIACAARPAERIYLISDADGWEREERRLPPPEVEGLRRLLWTILEHEGKTLAALNASLFAGRISDEVSGRITELKRDLADRLVRTYCVGKGVAVALNPIPLADLLALAADAAMIVQLGKLYGLPITPAEGGRLFRAIAGQTLLLMGAVYGTQLAASALKGFSGGLSIALTAGAQGAMAYYGSYVIGKAAERYFAQGRSWGPGGPKQVVREILDTLDRQSILTQAKEEILTRLKGTEKEAKP
ncbi:MAG: GTP-binding protein [Magnetococcales bacterium]|nr:GTP-binding protein [Magnetococcales bacterium]